MGTKTGAADGLNITDDDESGDGQDLDTGNTGADDEGSGEPEDRGDDLFPPADKAALKAVAGDEEEEEDGEGEGGGEGEGEGEEGEGKTPKTVPYGRLAAATAKLREKEEENARLRAELEASGKGGKAKQGASDDGEGGEAGDGEGEDKQVDVDALEAQYLEAVTEGRTKDALQIRKDINAELERRAIERATANTEAQRTRKQQEADFAEAVQEVIDAYPVLDSKNAERDQELIDFVIAKRDRLIASGKAPAAALREAAKSVMEKFGQKDGDDGAGDGGGDGKSKPKGKDDPVKARQTQALARNAAAANGQPNSGGGKGNRAASAEQTDVAEMSDEEFDSLPEAEKRRLRGD